MTRLDVADNSMDVVVCVLGLYFAQDQPSAVAELWRVVKPGGTLAVTTWVGEHWSLPTPCAWKPWRRSAQT